MHDNGERNERREMIAAVDRQIGRLQHLKAKLIAAEERDEEGRRRLRLIRGSGAIAITLLTLRRVLLHIHSTTAAAILTAAASGALITAAAVTTPTSNAPTQTGPGVTITESAPPTRAARAVQPTRPAALPPQPAPAAPPTSIPSGIPGLMPSPSATPAFPLSPTPTPSITPAVPTPGVAVQPPGRRRRRHPIKVTRARLCSATDWTVMTKICTV